MHLKQHASAGAQASWSLLAALSLALLFLTPSSPLAMEPSSNPAHKLASDSKPTELATFGSGCFWCTEAVFEATRGVRSAESGYSGGATPFPTYEEVCTGTTGHAEVVQVEYDPEVVSYTQLLEIFFRTHDPTSLNRQGADAGTQYRSVVFTHDEKQRREVEEVKKRLDESGAYDDPIVTQIAPLEAYFKAEVYHQDYFAKNPRQGYCRGVIAPKMKKFRKTFSELLKEE